MKEKNISFREILKKGGEKNILSGVLIIVFFIALISGYYLRMYSSARDSIIARGETRALKAAEQFVSFIDAEKIIVQQEKFTTEKMLRDGKGHDEIVEYMTAYTRMIQTTVNDRITGAYGYVDGEYCDGADWIPYPGFEPTERPWYKAAIGNNGETTLVEPYVDARLGTVTMTVAQALEDGSSVVAVDLSYDMLKEVSGEDGGEADGSIELVMNTKGDVLAHTEQWEIGHNYLDENNTLGAVVAEKVFGSDEECFEVSFDDNHYVAYVIPIEDSWYSVSLIDSKDSYRPLRIMFLITLLLIVISICVLVALFYDLMNKTVTLGNEKKRSYELELITERAMAANEAKSSFLSNMSHEIRTPINAILGMNEMIIRESTDEQAVEYAYSVKAAGDTLLGIINDVLDLSKIEAGKLELIPVDYDLASVLNDLVTMIQPRAESKGLELKLDFDRSTPNLLHGDEIRIKQIISNILTNAVKYTEEGKVTFGVSYEEIPGNDSEINLKVYVRDTGTGIRPEDMDKIFNEFQRLDEKHNRNKEGTGLGMPITQSLLNMMGSSLSVKSTYGEGSEFGFVLTQKVRGTQILGDYETTQRNAVRQKVSKTGLLRAPEAQILVIDDMKVNLKVFEKLLKRTEVNIDSVTDGDSGIEFALKKRYDLIFLDHMMPGKDGIETLNELRSHKDGINKDTPVICLTANAVSGAREMYISAGFNDYLTKPIAAQKLEEMLVEYLPEEKVILNSTEEKNGDS